MLKGRERGVLISNQRGCLARSRCAMRMGEAVSRHSARRVEGSHKWKGKGAKSPCDDCS